MTRKALARRIAESYLTSQQRGEAPAPPQPEGLRGFWPGALLLVGQRPQRVFSLLAPRTQPKFAAALLYEPQTWCTRRAASVSLSRTSKKRPGIVICLLSLRKGQAGQVPERSRHFFSDGSPGCSDKSGTLPVPSSKVSGNAPFQRSALARSTTRKFFSLQETPVHRGRRTTTRTRTSPNFGIWVNMREPLLRDAVTRNLLVFFWLRLATCECIRLFCG